ncbi:MAG: hypothetical protein ACR2NZ_18205 [Rubripirellula sp.]
MHHARFRHAIWVSLFVTSILGANEPPQVFDLPTYKTFIDMELSRVRPNCSMAEMGIRGRPVRGRLVNHLGAPMSDVIVALVEPIGHSLDCFYENFDVTDEQGRFNVAGSVSKNRLIFRQSNGRTWRLRVTDLQDDRLVRWPPPSTITAHLSSALRNELSVEEADDEASPRLSLQTEQYWGGMSIMVIAPERVSDGDTVFKHVLPANYALTIPKTIDVAGQRITRRIELRRVHVQPGEHQQLSLVPNGGTRLSGKCPIGSYLVVSRMQQTYEDCPAAIELVAIDEGHFETRPLPKGDYRVEAHVHGNNPALRRMGDSAVRRWNIRIDGTEGSLKLDELPQPSKLEAAVTFILDSSDDSRVSLRSLTARWPEHEVLSEFANRLNDDAIPYFWRRRLPNLAVRYLIATKSPMCSLPHWNRPTAIVNDVSWFVPCRPRLTEPITSSSSLRRTLNQLTTWNVAWPFERLVKLPSATRNMPTRSQNTLKLRYAIAGSSFDCRQLPTLDAWDLRIRFPLC